MTAGALAIEAVFGYPDALFRAIRHPVVWIGAAFSYVDRNLNRPGPARRVFGTLSLLAVLTVVCVLAWALQSLLLPQPGGVLILAILASTLPAQRSLYRHVRAVADALETGGVAAGRVAVAHIVGRDPDRLDQAGIVRAAIESLAENFSDGIVAPAFWGAVLGLPGMAAYKAINTADSMLGHRTERHEEFGWASARLDDLVNLPASRLAALFLILASLSGAAIRAVLRDARRHRSPNAGWPEAAMAGALGLRLAGPRVYHGMRVEDSWMGDGSADPTPSDLRRALALYCRACAIQFAAILVALLLTWPG